MGTFCIGTSSVDGNEARSNEGSGATDETVSRSKAEEPPANSPVDFRCWILRHLGIDPPLKSSIVLTETRWRFTTTDSVIVIRAHETGLACFPVNGSRCNVEFEVSFNNTDVPAPGLLRVYVHHL